MKNKIKINVYEVVGSPLCVSSSDGEKVFKRVKGSLDENMPIILSFRNVSTLTSAFLNTAIGQLYGSFDEDTIRSLLEVEEMDSDDLSLLKRVVETAKKYFNEPGIFKESMRDLTGEDGDDL